MGRNPRSLGRRCTKKSRALPNLVLRSSSQAGFLYSLLELPGAKIEADALGKRVEGFVMIGCLNF